MLADKHGVNLEERRTWAFEFEDQPTAGFACWRQQRRSAGAECLSHVRQNERRRSSSHAVTSSAEVPLEKIMSDGVRGEPDVAALGSVDATRLSILVWHYHDDDLPGPDAAVDLTITGMPGGDLHATRYLIDKDHSNAFEEWKKLGLPAKPTDAQYKQLEAAGKLATVDAPAQSVKDGKTSVKFDLALGGDAVGDRATTDHRTGFLPLGQEMR
jgi:xylan 1,4-beta-xylosidase